jgi:ferric-dicitrate binding protein FerR (iron transport regulator)
MKKSLEDLAAELRRYRQGRESQGVRYPGELRRRAVAACSLRLAAGESVAGVASALGIAPGTLERWRSSTPLASGSFRRVELADGSPRDGDSGSITVVSPSGYRIEGLTPSQAAQFLVAMDAGQ